MEVFSTRFGVAGLEASSAGWAGGRAPASALNGFLGEMNCGNASPEDIW
jgi:hypothetical protein